MKTISGLAIGRRRAVSNGCVRLLNQEVIDLYQCVPDCPCITVVQ